MEATLISCGTGEELGRFRIARAKGGGGAAKKGLARRESRLAVLDRWIFWNISGDEKKGGSLRVRPDGAVDMQGGAGVWARFLIEPKENAENDGRVTLTNAGHTLQQEKRVYLTWRSGTFGSTSDPGAESEFFLKLDEHVNMPFGMPAFGTKANENGHHKGGPVTIEECLQGSKDADDGWAVVDGRQSLSFEEKASFVRNGFLVVRDAVPARVADAALRAINRGLGDAKSAFRANNDNKTAKLSAQRDRESINRLLVNPSTMSAISDIMEDLVFYTNQDDENDEMEDGEGARPPPSQDFDDGARRRAGLAGPRRLLGDLSHQVALRYPADDAMVANPPELEEVYRRRWHVDGIGKGRLTPFSLLVGVALSDQLESGTGNLWAIRGSHTVNGKIVSEIGQKMMSEGVGYEHSMWNARRPNFEHIEPTPVLLKKGDIVIIHSKTAHAIGINLSPNIRYQVYFRVRHPDLDSTRKEAFIEDMWCGFNPEIKVIAASISDSD